VSRIAFGLLRGHDLGVNGGNASLAEVDTALGVVAPGGFFCASRCGRIGRVGQPAFFTTVCHCLAQAVTGQPKRPHCFCEAVAHGG
jgi:hypothetical protein